MPRVHRVTTTRKKSSQHTFTSDLAEVLEMNPWIVLISVTLVAVGAIFYASNKFYNQIADDSQSVSELKIPQDTKAWIEIDFGLGHKRLFEGVVEKEVYPFSSVLRVVSENHNFTVDIRKGAIKSIDGVGKSSGSWKIYNRQGALVSAPLDSLTLKGGDWYTLRYEK